MDAIENGEERLLASSYELLPNHFINAHFTMATILKYLIRVI